MKTIFCLLSACVLLAGAATLAAPAQDGTLQAGQPTALQPLRADAPPLRVQLTGAPTVTRQAWEYRGISVPAGQDVLALLNAAGAEGWETTGVGFSAQNVAVIVMKRPR